MAYLNDLTQEYLKSILFYDIAGDYWVWRVGGRGGTYAGMKAGSLRDGYLVIKIDGKSYRAHRLRHLYLYGVWPTNELDHKNRIPWDNSEGNLRDATSSQNKANREKFSNNTSGFKGVCWNIHLHKWNVQIGKDNKLIFLGYFTDLIDAAQAYDRAALYYFKEFAFLNFPELKGQYLKESVNGRKIGWSKSNRITKADLAQYALETGLEL